MVTKRMTEKRVNKLIAAALKKQAAARHFIKEATFAQRYGVGPTKMRSLMGLDSNSARFATPNGELTLTGSPEFIIEVLTRTGFIQVRRQTMAEQAK